MATAFPSQAHVVVIGGGIVGCSTAYHLAKLGCDVVLLERKKLTSGTTWHAAGLVSETQGVPVMSKLARYGLDLMAQLHAETGQATGFNRCGSMTLALHDGRMEELRRKLDYAHGCGITASEISLAEAQQRWPLLSTEGAKGAFWFPGDGYTNPIDTTMALAKGARLHGAQIFEETKVEKLVIEGGQVVGVETNQGQIKAAHVVNATGMWAREFGLGHGVAVPLHYTNHYYVVTDPIEGVHNDLPVLRVMDEYAYYKADAGKLLIGCSEPHAQPWLPEGGLPEHFEFDELPCDEEHLFPILEPAMERVPALADCGIRTFFNGPESFTPDGRHYLGPLPKINGLWVAAGFNSTGIQNGPGAGKALAEWIMTGQMSMDLTDVDSRRIICDLNSQSYVASKAAETLSLAYAMHWPTLQRQAARGLRRSPFYRAQEDAGAQFTSASGWERPMYYGRELTHGFGYQAWHADWQAEHNALREDLGLIDLTFGRFNIEGPEAKVYLQSLCTADMAMAKGHLAYCHMLNEQGGVEADITVARVDQDSYIMLCSAGAEAQTHSWLQQHAKHWQVHIANTSSAQATLALMGPRSRDFLHSLTDANLSAEAFAFGSFQTIHLGHVPVRAQRITYVGELGWELHMDSCYAQQVYETIMATEQPPRLCGGLAVDSCRIEKGFRHWGHDMGAYDHLVHCGLSFTCAMDTDFIGKQAVLEAQQTPMPQRLVQVLLEDANSYIYGKEPIVCKGQVVGKLTSASYSWTFGSAIGMGYVDCDGLSVDELLTRPYQVMVAGRPVAAKISLKAFYDPTHERMRS